MLQTVPTETMPDKSPRAIPSLDKRFLVDLKGKEFVTYAGLLDLAHQHGLTQLKVDLVQFPCAENGMECIVKAMAVTESGMLFCDIGDANPHNTNKSVAQHIIRMASTRAKARVLRDMTNIGITALEELGDDVGDLPGNGNGRAKPRQVVAGKRSQKVAGKASGQPKNVSGITSGAITDAQKRAIWALAKSRGHDEASLHDFAEESFGCGVAGLSNKDAAALIIQLQKSPE
jgi:hypothetical protein